MDGTTLPAVRVPAIPIHTKDGDGVAKEVSLVELPPSDKFGFAWPSDTSSGTIMSLAAPSVDHRSEVIEFDSTSSESVSQESSPLIRSIPELDPSDHTPTAESPTDTTSVRPPIRSRLSRAFSIPLPSQLGYLQNPHRSGVSSVPTLSSPLIDQSIHDHSYIQEFSVELADSVQMVIQTLLQISPPQLLDSAKEQFASCSLSIPSPSISAVFTAMKNLNYMSANMLDIERVSGTRSLQEPEIFTQDDFDIGEILQSVGDALSGMAAQAGVDLVLYHGDVGMKHVSVKADECGLSFALSHVVRQIINTAHRGDTIEIGLFVNVESPQSTSTPSVDGTTEPTPPSPSLSTSKLSELQDSGSRWLCIFDIAHKFNTVDPLTGSQLDSRANSPDNRALPVLDSLNLAYVLRRMGAIVRTELQPRLFANGRSCEIIFPVSPGSPDVLTRQHLTAEVENFLNGDVQLANEPSLEELQSFVESLRGKKVALHASAKGSFAHHLTSYLTAWGLDVSHMSASYEEAVVFPINSTFPSDAMSSIAEEIVPAHLTSSPSVLDATIKDTEGPVVKTQSDGPPAFIIIDDDVNALRQQLIQMRSELPYSMNMQGRKRPSLSAHHRPRSSPQIAKVKGAHGMSANIQGKSVIVHFTNLSNFKLVRDVLQSVLSESLSKGVIPEVIVIPKPAGPRRFLTALRTALLKPVVDPFFSPIATSPISPNIHGGTLSPFFNNSTSSNTRKSARPSAGQRTNSDRSSKSSGQDNSEQTNHAAPPSPLGKDNLEYFEEAAMKLGTSPASGLVIQSSDGSPAGIFFQPRGAQKSPPARSDGGIKDEKKSGVSHFPAIIHEVGNVKIAPTSRASTTLRHRNSLITYPSMESVTSSKAEAITFASSSGFSAKGREPTSPLVEELVVQMKDSTSPPRVISPPVPTVESTSVRRTTSPPHSPLSPRSTPSAGTGATSFKRSTTRRQTGDVTPSTAPNSKKPRTSGESNIVPPINVLIVEDNPINQTILSTFMRRKKLKYDVAKNGEEAVSKWRTGEYHLILMDIQMPVMDGIEATRQIRKLEKQEALGIPSTPSDGQNTPSERAMETPSVDSDRRSSVSTSTPFKFSVIIVALTASSLESDRVAALAAGCNDFLTKPVSLHWLNNKIIEWGSIKALQMWADLRPEFAKSISREQVAQAKDIAKKLHVPTERQTGHKSRSHSRSLSRASTRRAVLQNVSQEDEVIVKPSYSNSSLSTMVEASEQSEMSNTLSRHPAVPAILSQSLENNEDHSSSQSHASHDEQYNHTDSDSVPSDNEDNRLTSHVSPPPYRHPTVISGEDALKVHLEDSKHEVKMDSLSTHEQPIILGQRALSSGNISIAEVLHPSSSTILDDSNIQRDADDDDTSNSNHLSTSKSNEVVEKEATAATSSSLDSHQPPQTSTSGSLV